MEFQVFSMADFKTGPDCVWNFKFFQWPISRQDQTVFGISSFFNGRFQDRTRLCLEFQVFSMADFKTGPDCVWNFEVFQWPIPRQGHIVLEILRLFLGLSARTLLP